MTYGQCRITTIDAKGRAIVEDVEAGDLWYFPAGLPHSLQGLGPDGAEFVLVFDDGAQSESNTLLLTDFTAHMPLEILAKNFGVDQAVFKDIPLHNLWIFQGELPGDLQADREAAEAGAAPDAVVYHLARTHPVHQNSGGTIQLADSSNFPISKTIAAALVTLQPGSMRELHWHPNADEWQYYIKGQGRMTVFNTGPKATTNDFKAGDVGVVKRNLGHYVENTGTDVLQFLEIFRAPHYEEVSLAQWLGHVPPEIVSQHLNIPVETLKTFPREARGITPL
jgi:oxalate decarboxylase